MVQVEGRIQLEVLAFGLRADDLDDRLGNLTDRLGHLGWDGAKDRNIRALERPAGKRDQYILQGIARAIAGSQCGTPCSGLQQGRSRLDPNDGSLASKGRSLRSFSAAKIGVECSRGAKPLTLARKSDDVPSRGIAAVMTAGPQLFRHAVLAHSDPPGPPRKRRSSSKSVTRGRVRRSRAWRGGLGQGPTSRPAPKRARPSGLGFSRAPLRHQRSRCRRLRPDKGSVPSTFPLE